MPVLESFNVAFNALMSLVLESTFDFNEPTVTPEEPIVTPSAMLPELIVALLSVALVRIAPSAFAYALNALNTVPPATSPVSPEATEPFATTSTA